MTYHRPPWSHTVTLTRRQKSRLTGQTPSQGQAARGVERETKTLSRLHFTGVINVPIDVSAHAQ